MTLALPNGLFRLQNHLRSLSWPSSTSTLKAFRSSIAHDGEETPAMKALKDIPYPTASPDLSIFESWSNEYSSVRLPCTVLARQSTRRATSSRSVNQGHYASSLLEQLSRNGKFAEAEEVRRELVEMNVPIRPSSTYYHAAWNVLRRRPWPPNRTEMFTNWLSLFPTIAENKGAAHFTELKSALLFSSNRLDLESIARFGIILSSKGYIRSVGATVVACLTRYAHPDLSSRILDEMLAADNNHKRGLGLPWTRYRDTSKRLWSIAVRTHCTARRPKVALQVAKRAHQHGVHLTLYTYEYLLGKLEADGLHDSAAEIRALPGFKTLSVAKNRFVVEEVSSAEPILPISPKHSRFKNRALALAILKRSSHLGLPAYATDIVPYFDIYKTDLRGSKAVISLRARAYRLSVTAASAVLLAELVHHHRRGQFKHVLWVFEKFFHVVGVPSEDVTQRLWKRNHYPPHMHIHYWSLPSRITETSFNLPSRLWPTTHHTALVWSALVHLCETEEEFFTLYDRLLQHSARHFQKKPAAEKRHPPHPPPCGGGGGGSSSDSTASTPVPVPAPVDRYDAAHFRPFFIAFTLLRGAKYSLRVLDDMQDRGVAPTAPLLSTAAALQARHGEPVIAMRMLDVIWGLLEEHEEEGQEEAHKTNKTRRRQQLLLSAYTGVLRGLVDRRALVQARQVAEMLRERLGYAEMGSVATAAGDHDGSSAGGGGNARTDAALRYLRRLEVEGPDAEPEPLIITASEVDDWQQRQYYYPFLKKRDPEVGYLPPPFFF